MECYSLMYRFFEQVSCAKLPFKQNWLGNNRKDLVGFFTSILFENWKSHAIVKSWFHINRRFSKCVSLMGRTLGMCTIVVQIRFTATYMRT